jgi:hypothetical protein
MDGAKFSSGVERLLSMLDKFQASKTDLEQMRWAEERIFKLMVAWSNYYQGNTEILEEDLQGGVIPEEAEISINFIEPDVVQTIAEKEDSAIKRIDKSLMTRKQAIMDLDGVDEATAEKIIKEIDDEKKLSMEMFQQNADGTPIVEEKDQDEEKEPIAVQ